MTPDANGWLPGLSFAFNNKVGNYVNNADYSDHHCGFDCGPRNYPSSAKKIQTNRCGWRNEAANKQVYVGNLPYQVTEQDLKDYFGKYGVIEAVRIVKNYSSGRSKGFGFVTYRSVGEAKNALVAHGQKYKDRTIVVRIAKPR